MSDVAFRRATQEDLAAIVRLLADDQLGATRDDPGPPLSRDYVTAFRAIDADPQQLLLVATSGEDVIGTAQLSFLPGLARRGALRMQIEAVRVASSHRGSGVGRRLLQWCIAVAEQRGCTLVQLTSDATRVEAHRFYRSLGFVDSHIGFKLHLTDPGRHVG